MITPKDICSLSQSERIVYNNAIECIDAILLRAFDRHNDTVPEVMVISPDASNMSLAFMRDLKVVRALESAYKKSGWLVSLRPFDFPTERVQDLDYITRTVPVFSSVELVFRLPQ
jgi:hypothetical protein